MTASSPAIAQLPKVRRANSLSLAWRRFLTRKTAVVALIFILLQVLAGFVFAKVLSPYDPYYSDYTATYKSYTPKHILGTDDMGRDILSRIIYGARVSYAVGVLSQIALVLLGLPIGALAGLLGGWLDWIVMRIIDVLSSIPGLLLYILLMIALGPGLENIIIAMSITGWIGIARLVRGQVLTIKESDYVRASRSMGGNTVWITRAHIMRNALSPVIVSMTLGVPGAMFAEAGLSFMGIGIAPPTPSWGQMIGVYQSYVLAFPYLLIYPSLVLAVTMLAWIFLGDGVRDALDPNIRI
jgi:ABC-type dipeptide/oligopeptide/nickel transport system permease subunit